MPNRWQRSSSSVLFLFLAACATAQITNTARSSVEQELLVRALDRSMAKLDVHQLRDKTVTVDFYGLTPDKDFAKEYFTAWLQSQGVQIAPDPKLAQLRLKVFASVLAVDQGQLLIGSPSFTVPLIGIGVPEIALFKNVEHSGHAELQMFLLNAQSGKFLSESVPATGSTEHNDYTILLVIHFTRTDLEEQPRNSGAD